MEVPLHSYRRLDTIDELSESFRRNEQNEHHHQANPADITIEDRFDSCQNRTGPYNPFERFDIEGDEETQFNAFSQEHTIPPSNMHSPPHNMEPQPAVDVFNQQPEKQGSESTPRSGESEQKEQPGSRKRIPARNRARRQAPFLMDVEQTMIPSNLYQSWLQNSTDIRSSRPKITERDNTTSARKISKLMDLPPVAVCCGLVGKNNDVHYPKPLLVQWLESMQQPHDSPSGRTTSPRPPEPSSSSPPSGQGYQDPPLREVLRDGITSERLSPRENIMDNQPIGTEVPNPILNAMFPSEGRTNPMVSAHDSGASLRSLSLGSPSSGHQVFSNTSDNSGRNNKKRPSTRLTGTGLESVDEGSQWIHDAGELNLAQTELGFKKPRRPQYGLTPEHELLVQTGPTQTLRPLIDEETEKMTKNVATHLKQYFETPGAPQIESLNQLAYGMNRKQAAQLFYQTCVLVTRDVLRVEQKLAYGDIIVSRGAKM